MGGVEGDPSGGPSKWLKAKHFQCAAHRLPLAFGGAAPANIPAAHYPLY